jgi:hypothetical protein
MKKTIEELALKAVLSIGKQNKCLLLDFCCSRNISCSGERIPWCNLEILLMDKCKDIAGDLQKEKIIKILYKIQKHLAIKNKRSIKQQFLTGKENFHCPFFKILMEPCSLNICPYYSAITKNTACLLSSTDSVQLPLSHISISKNISREKLLALVFNIEAGDKWETVIAYINELKASIKSCDLCGCTECSNPQYCQKRRSVSKQLLDESMIPDAIKQYPLMTIVLATHKVFGPWAKYLFPKKPLKIYIESIYQERTEHEQRTEPR